MTIRMHRSTDLSAPSLTGQQGKMGALLLDVLCKGIPSAAPTTITQTGGTATCTYPSHKFVTGQTVSIYGATQTGYNGNKVVTVTDANTFTFPVSAGTASPATGTISVGGQRTIGTASSVTRSGTTVTVALTAHGLSVGNRVLLSGANQTDYNGWKTVATVVNANTFTVELPSALTPATPATGTVIVRYGEAALGWTMPFTTTNRNIFKQGASGAKNQYVLVVDETNSAYHQYGANMLMAEGATSVSTLTGAMYTNDLPNSTGMLKSGTQDATAHPWVVVGDERTIIVLVKPQVAGSSNTDGWTYSYFGDIVSYVPSDAYGTVSYPSFRGGGSYLFNSPTSLINNGGTTSYGNTQYANYPYVPGANDDYYPGRFSRNHLGATGRIQTFFVCSGGCFTNTSNIGAAIANFGYRHPSYSQDVYPNPVHGGVDLEKIYLNHTASADNSGTPVVRGEMRGLWNIGHKRTSLSSWSNNDTVMGSGELAGRVFEMFDLTHQPNTCIMIEVSDTWSV